MLAIAKLRLLAGVITLTAVAPMYAQEAQRTISLDSLIATSLSDHPAIRAAAGRVEAARARVRPAGALPDPMLMAGIENLPLGRETTAAGHGAPPPEDDMPDMMTMKMVGVSQMVPFPGKLNARRRAAEQRVNGVQARLDEVRNRVVRDIRHSYFELAYIERALEITRAAHAANLNIERAAQARYAAGTGEQRAVLDARVATAEFAQQAIALEEQLRAQRALLAAALGDTTERAIGPITIPQRMVPESLRPVATLQELAVRNNPMLRVRRSEIAALTYEVDIARKEYLPDFDLSVRYGQRNGRPDMISASVAIPIPIQKGRKQDQLVRAGEADLTAAQAELVDATNRVRADVAQLHADLERIRAQLALFSKSIIPHAQAAIASATASLETGRIELFSVLERQNTLREYQIAFERLLADFAQKTAQLESIVGAEVLP
jgi:cobalt-zinc-cadmium efflux system outer membrane protein